MDSEIQLISDGDGVAVIGDPALVEQFLAAEGLPSKDLGLPKLGSALSTASAVAQAGSELAANSGRWVKLTEKSARALKQSPELMKGSEAHTFRAVLTKNGKVSGLLEFSKGPGALLTNPAVLAGAAGLMAQLAMQQTMDEITDYLAAIDEKVDDVLRAQKDAVLADMIGVGFVIDEAMTIREQVGRVSEVTWSKVQATPGTIARTQAYALGQLDALADKLEKKSKIGDLAKASKEAESTTQEWLTVLARCFQLQDAVGILELDRVLDASPDELDRHRVALRTARHNRTTLISRATGQLMERLGTAAVAANSKVLMHPTSSREVVQASNQVSLSVVDFHARLGIEQAGQSLEARRWLEAAAEAREKALTVGGEGVDTAKRLGGEGVDTAKRLGEDGLDAAKRVGGETFSRAKFMTGKLSSGLSDRAMRRRSGDEDPDA
ncbi:hypothetical protein LJR027_004081 [Terrabacter sp. LjRoot27]|uniref:hypothetical protein n=1 Tax=Terrabacter sp. LjRoot27 TaxID=3342306 RepID=UPI003ECE40F8